MYEFVSLSLLQLFVQKQVIFWEGPGDYLAIINKHKSLTTYPVDRGLQGRHGIESSELKENVTELRIIMAQIQSRYVL